MSPRVATATLSACVNGAPDHPEPRAERMSIIDGNRTFDWSSWIIEPRRTALSRLDHSMARTSVRKSRVD